MPLRYQTPRSFYLISRRNFHSGSISNFVFKKEQVGAFFRDMSQKWSASEPADEAEVSIFNPQEVSVKWEGMTSRRAGFQDRNKLRHFFRDLGYEDEMERSTKFYEKEERKKVGKSAIQLNTLREAISRNISNMISGA